MIFVGIAVSILVAFIGLLIKLDTTPKDNREPYLRNSMGLSYALMVRGPVDNVPNHEDFIHDGTPHQNPVVKRDIITKHFLFIPYSLERETRWYPLTISQSSGVNFERLSAAVHNARAKGKDVAIVMMDNEIERLANIRENQTQEGKGHEELMFNRRGKPIWKKSEKHITICSKRSI